ncbi:MAG: hypothetical protein ACXU9U_03110 [Parachlamydiaceae bacterium]
MKQYASVFLIYLKQQFSYRTHLFFTMLSGIIPFLGIYFIWHAIYVSNPQMSIGGYGKESMLSYAILAYFISQLMSPFKYPFYL